MRSDLRKPTSAHGSRRSRPGLVRDESGQGLVEFAFILPVLMLILVGILEFGSVYNDVSSLRQGVREAGRKGSVGSFGPACNPALTGLSPAPDTQIQNLICQTKNQVGSPAGISVKVVFDDANFNPGATWTVGNSVVICAIYPLHSLTGLFQPFLNGRFVKTKSTFRIEKDFAAPAPQPTAGGETAPAGTDWNWCT